MKNLDSDISPGLTESKNMTEFFSQFISISNMERTKADQLKQIIFLTYTGCLTLLNYIGCKSLTDWSQIALVLFLTHIHCMPDSHTALPNKWTKALLRPCSKFSYLSIFLEKFQINRESPSFCHSHKFSMAAFFQQTCNTFFLSSFFFFFSRQTHLVRKHHFKTF